MRPIRSRSTTTILIPVFAIFFASTLAVCQSGAENPGFMAAKGRVTFKTYCASCHGLKAIGDGEIAQYLTVEPADLTQLEKKHGGEFPDELIQKIIDGRQDVRGHGGDEMPVWGDVFQSPLAHSSTTSNVDGEERAQTKIRELVLYLQSIQVE